MKMVTMYEATEQVEFAKRAAVSFRDNPKYRSYSDNGIVAGDLLALRWGSDDDCVVVLRMSKDYEITNYQNIIEPKSDSSARWLHGNVVLPNGKIVTERGSNGLWVVFNKELLTTPCTWESARTYKLPTFQDLLLLACTNKLLNLGLGLPCWSHDESKYVCFQDTVKTYNFRTGTYCISSKQDFLYVHEVQYMTDEQLLNEANK